MRTNMKLHHLSHIQSAVKQLTAQVQDSGKRAFDRDDPIAAKREAERLERIDRVEKLIDELDQLLVELGIGETLPEQVAIVRETVAPITYAHKPMTAKKGVQRLPEKALHPPQLRGAVLEVLQELGGVGNLKDIWSGVERRMSSQFTASDVEKMKNHKNLRWQYNVCWTLTVLKNEGHVERAGKRGFWRLTTVK